MKIVNEDFVTMHSPDVHKLFHRFMVVYIIFIYMYTQVGKSSQ